MRLNHDGVIAVVRRDFTNDAMGLKKQLLHGIAEQRTDGRFVS